MGPLARTILFLLAVPGAVLLIPLLLLAPAGWAARMAAWQGLGLAPLAAGVALVAWAGWDFATRGRGTPAPVDPPRALVMTGPYRHVRNPMYLGVVVALVGEAALTAAPIILGYAAVFGAIVHGVLVLVEEPDLRRRFGAAYDAYCARVPRWLPRVGLSAARAPSAGSRRI